MESVLQEYRSSLSELTFNSKPLINMLTVLAEENYSYAPDLVKIIETQVYQSPPNQRLPVLYLIDSIVKTYGPYVKLFSPNLIKTFLFAFEKAETKVRQDLYKLRYTWNGIFSKSLLRDLDLSITKFDPNWPVKKSNLDSARKSKSHKSVHPSGLTVEERVAVLVSRPQKSRESPSQLSKEEDHSAIYEDYIASNPLGEGGDILVEEEEILVDEERYDELEALEQELLRKKEELGILESMDDEPSTSGYMEKSSRRISTQSSESPTVQKPYFIDTSSQPRPQTLSPMDGVSETWRKRKEESSTSTPQETKRTPLEEDEQLRIGPSRHSTPEDHLFISEKQDTHTQTEVTSKDSETQITIDVQDQTTQYRYRKKTKNFLSQYRVPSKSVATYFRIKTKEAQTQYIPQTECNDTQADSTTSVLDSGNGIFSGKERSALKDYVAALKDDFLPREYSKHSGLMLKNLCAQRRQGILCDITLGAEGRVFKAHKSVLASSCDFFFTLFAREESEKTPLSHIELQGITAKALNLVLDYVYTSVLPMVNLSSIEEIIIAAKRLQIHSLVKTCPALEQAVAKKIDMAGWLVSNSSLLSPSNKHPYVEALRSLRDLGNSASFLAADANRFNHDSVTGGAGDASAGDFICHVDRDTTSKKRSSEMVGYGSYSNDEVRHKKRKRYTDKSDTESDYEADDSMKNDERSKKDEKFDAGVLASPGMPPSSWVDMYSPGKGKKKRRGVQDSSAAAREQAVYKCNNCSRHIISRRNYISHCEAHARKGEKPYGCEICKKMFWKESDLESHLMKIHTRLSPDQVEQLTKSKVCSPYAEDVLKKRDQYSPTSSSSKRKQWKCQECKVVVQSESAYIRHLKMRHGRLYRLKCQYCKQYFKTAASRAAHIKKHKKNGDLAKSKRKNSGELDSAEDASSDAAAYSSVEEEKSRPPVESNRDDDSSIRLKLYHCEICGEMFSVQCFYKEHMAGHDKESNDY